MGKLFKLYLERNTHTSKQEYESNDGRGTRCDYFESYTYKAHITEMCFDPEWKKEYSKTQEEVKQTLSELKDKLAFLGIEYSKATIEVNIPLQVKAKWVGSNRVSIDLSKGEYETLLSATHKEERAGRASMYEVDIAYFHFHYGIRGQYLTLFGEPGAERHSKKGYLDKYIDLSETEQASDAVLSIMAKLLEKGYEEKYEWDYRYMPEFQQIPSPNQGTLGDLLKGLNL